MFSHEERKSLRETDWSANVRDEFKGMSVSEVIEALEPNRNGFHMVFENALRDFNFGGLIRASNGFCCNGITYSGFRRYDPRGTVGTKNYEDITYLPDSNDLIDFIVARQKADNIPFIVAEFLSEDHEFYHKQSSLVDFQWPDKCTVMFGEEGTGVSDKFLRHADYIVYVPMLGSVRSFNVASTAHMFMYDYMVKTGRMK